MKNNTIIPEMVLMGGCNVGNSTNPDTKRRPSFIEVNGEKVVCMAQGGECRYNPEFYTVLGLSDPISWRTPIISRSCPNKCGYKYLVCEGHEHKDEATFIPYPRYNKFRGEFYRYCRDFSCIEKECAKEDKKENRR